MVVRLSKAFGGSPDSWLRMQMAYDLAQTQKRANTIHVKRFVPPLYKIVNLLHYDLLKLICIVKYSEIYFKRSLKR